MESEVANPALDDAGRANPSRPVFLPVILAGILVLTGGYLAIHIGYVSARFKPALNQPAPATARAGLTIEPVAPPLARRVVLVIIDGLRLRDSYGWTFLDRLRRIGVDSAATSHYPSFSRPNQVTIVTGVPPAASGVRTNDYNQTVMLDSLMDRAAAAGMRSGFAADYTNGLPIMFTHLDPDVDDILATRAEFSNAFFDPVMTTWPNGLEAVVRRMIDANHPLLVVIPGAVDAAGHQYGGDAPEYRDAVQAVDAMLGRALDRLDLTQDAIIITADHGHTDEGGHGGLELDVLEVPLIMAGAGIRSGAAIVDAELADIAPTAAVLLGLPVPAHGLGRTLTEALELDGDGDAAAAVTRADAERIERNRVIFEAWRRTGNDMVAGTRLWRVPLVVLLVALGIVLLVAANRVHALQIDWRVLLIALPAFPASYYALLAVFGQQFSPSFVPDRGDLEPLLFRFGLLSTAAHIVASWVAFRGRVILAERLATANGLFVCGLLMSLSAGGLTWALWPGPFIDIPSPRLLVLIPATYVACACYGLAVVATLGLEIVIFFARAVDPRILRSRLRRRRHLPRAHAV